MTAKLKNLTNLQRNSLELLENGRVVKRDQQAKEHGLSPFFPLNAVSHTAL